VTPSYAVDIQLIHKPSGREINRTVNLTPEESELLANLEGNSKRAECMGSLESVRFLAIADALIEK
jgi:hypothetical protein